MPLVEPLAADHDAEVAELARFFNETLGFPPNSVLTMQRRPAIAKAFIELNKAVMENQGRVTSEQKRLIGYIASLTAGCRYCQAHTARAAERYGGSDERLAEIWNYERSDLFTPAERRHSLLRKPHRVCPTASMKPMAPNCANTGAMVKSSKSWA
ncbi:MAG: carboxymuconolactone decarboxylase family protein [Terricaulis sp.]